MAVTTRWWWVRHAPVTGHGGRIYGQDDVPADCSDAAAFRALAAALPDEAVWLTSHLARTHQTAEAILRHAGPPALGPLAEPDLAEQHFGAWQGRSHAELAAARAGAWHRFWLAPAAEAPPGGESFARVVERVAAAVERLSAEHAGRDVVAVAHGGTIRAALALALSLSPERALAFTVDNCSLTRLEHIAGPAGSHAGGETAAVWRVAAVNRPPR